MLLPAGAGTTLWVGSGGPSFYVFMDIISLFIWSYLFFKDHIKAFDQLALLIKSALLICVSGSFSWVCLSSYLVIRPQLFSVWGFVWQIFEVFCAWQYFYHSFVFNDSLIGYNILIFMFLFPRLISWKYFFVYSCVWCCWWKNPGVSLIFFFFK